MYFIDLSSYIIIFKNYVVLLLSVDNVRFRGIL